MTLKLFNTLSRRLETFEQPPQDPVVQLYTCGPTVYDYQHVGNWSAYIYWDILVRTLIANGLKVERVMNITDVGHLVSDEDEGEDKLEKGARREGKTAWQVAEFYSEDFLNSAQKLGLLMPEHMARATDYINEQLELVKTLQKKGFTYQIDDGIYFDTSKFSAYANLARLDLKAQKAGARIAINTQKRQPSDFALWKFTPKDQKRDMEWETPTDLLGSGEDKAQAVVMGFPGWHLECSAIAMSLLGPSIDIHTGGIDHIPVHHTNEIAQSEAATGQHFSRFWLHNNHLKVNGTKISKSLNNGYTLEDLEKLGYSPMDFRMFILQGHYRSEGNFTLDNLAAAHSRLQNWRSTAAIRHQTYATLIKSNETDFLLPAAHKVIEALSDDLDTPEALRLIDDALSCLETTDLRAIDQANLVSFISTIDETLGLQLIDSTPDISDNIKELLLRRQRAREEKNWPEADKLRLELKELGIDVKDKGDKTVWFYDS